MGSSAFNLGMLPQFQQNPQNIQGMTPQMAPPAPSLGGQIPGGSAPATQALAAQAALPQGSAMQQFRQQLPGALNALGQNMQSAGAGMGPAPQMQMAASPQSQAVRGNPQQNLQNFLQMQTGNRRLPILNPQGY